MPNLGKRRVDLEGVFNPPCGKKTAAVHLTTIPCEPNSPSGKAIVPELTNIVNVMFNVFMSAKDL